MLLKNTKSSNDLVNINWPAPNVLAFSTTRKFPTLNYSRKTGQDHQNISTDKNLGNYSNTPYGFFNLGLHVGDNANNVRDNRDHLALFLPQKSKVQWLEQVHEATVYHAKAHSETAIVADAIYTTKNNLALAIMTADCLPILLSSHQGNEIAAIHGGWKPLAKNIIANTVEYFQAKGEHITAWLGPCIGATSFEVSADVYHVFTAMNNDFSQAFVAINEENQQEKYLCNLPLIASIQLRSLGITNIINQSSCTVLNPELYYSYRRDQQTGRMASVICLTP